MRSVLNYFTPPNGVPSTQMTTLPEPEVVSGPQYAQDAGMVPKSWFNDPHAMLGGIGLGYQESPTPLGYQTLAQMAQNHVITAAIIQLRMHQAAAFTMPQPNKYSIGYKIVHRDPNRNLTEGERNFCRRIEDFMAQGGEEETEGNDLVSIVKRLVRDRYTYDQMALETVSTFGGQPHAFYAVPGSTIRIATPKWQKGTPLHGRELDQDVRYVQVVDNKVVQTYTPREMAFSVANPRTDMVGWNYGLSEQELLIRTVTRHIWAEQWNEYSFSQGSTTKGILNVKGNMNQQNFEQFRSQWLAQISGVTNAWRTPLINSKEDLQWISLQPTNQEMGYSQWLEYLTKTACGIFLVDPAELNFDVRTASGQAPMFMSTNEAQQKLSQDRGLRPLLHQLSALFTKHIVKRFDPDWRFQYVGLDAKTEQQAVELRLKELGAYKTINEVRLAEQLPTVPYGDIIPSGAYIGYRNQKEMLASQQGQSGGPDQGSEGPEPGSEAAKLGDMIKRKVGDTSDTAGTRIPDRMRPTEEWEQTYNASLPLDDLQKALGPLDAYLRSDD